MIIDLDMNPDSGGSPIDSRVARVRDVLIGILFPACNGDNVVVAELWINNINIVKVIIM